MLTLNSRDVMLKEFRADKRSTVLRVRRGGPEIIALGPKDALIAQPGTVIGPGQTVLAALDDDFRTGLGHDPEQPIAVERTERLEKAVRNAEYWWPVTFGKYSAPEQRPAQSQGYNRHRDHDP